MRRRWKFNVRFAVILAFVLGLGAAGVLAAHAAFQSRVVASLRARADTLYTDEQWVQSARVYRQYLELAPEDFDARVQLAEAVASGASAPADQREAVRLYFDLLARPEAADRPDLRQRLCRLLLESGRFEDALVQAETLLANDSRDSTALSIGALARFEISARQKTTDWYVTIAALEDAAAARPPFADWLKVASRLAAAYRDPSVRITLPSGTSDGGPSSSVAMSDDERRAAADRVMDTLITENAERPQAWLARSAYRRRHGDPEADDDLDRAIALADGSPAAEALDVWLAAGRRESQAAEGADNAVERLAEAQRYYERAVAAAADEYEPYFGLSAACKQRFAIDGDVDSLAPAIARIRAALTSDFASDDVALSLELARLTHLAGHDDEAVALLSKLDELIRQGVLLGDDRFWTRVGIGVDSLRAQMLVDRGDLPAALSLLDAIAERAKRVTHSSRDYIAEPGAVYLLMADCYRQLQQPDRQAQALEEAILRGMDSNAVRHATARAWQAAGASELAERHLARLQATGSHFTPESLDAARWRARQIAAQPPDRRDWQPVLSIVEAARSRPDTRFEAQLLAAEIAVADGRREDAVKRLQEAQDAASGAPQQLRALTFAWQSIGLPDRADQVLHEHESLVGAEDAALLRAQLLAQRGDAPAAMATLEGALQEAAGRPASVRSINRLRVALSMLQLSQNDAAAARETLAPCIENETADIATVRLWATMALQSENWDDLERAEERLKRIEGDQGVDWRYYRARRLLAQADAPGDASDRLAEVERLAYTVESLRPHWLPGIELRARVLESQGQMSAAVAAYRRVIEAESNPSVKSSMASGVLDLLMSEGGADAINTRELSRLVGESTTLSLSAIGRELVAGDVEAAVEIGLEATRRNPGDAQLQLWYGYALQQAGRLDEARTALQRATQLAPTNETAWYALLGLVARAGRSTEVSALIREFMQSAGIPEPRRSIFVLRAAEMMGDGAAARRIADRLVETYGENATALKEAGRLYAGWDAGRAEQLLSEAYGLRPERDTARALARVMAANRGDDTAFAAARNLLTESHSGEALTDEDERVYAEILARRGRAADRREAIRILQKQLERAGQDGAVATEDAGLSARDVKLLAELLERDGQYEAAGELLTRMAADAEASDEQLFSYAAFLLRYGTRAHADYLQLTDETINRLMQVADREQANELNAVHLRIRWLSAAGESEKIMPLVSRVVGERSESLPNAQKRGQLLAALADTLREVGLFADAETLYRRAAETGPDGRFALIRFLAGKRNAQATAEALDVAYKLIADGAEREGAVALGQILVSAPTNDEQWRRAEQIVANALSRHPDDVNLLLTLSSMYCFQGRTQEAIPILRRVLARVPNSFQAKNNLAFALALEGDAAEASTAINQAIGLAGLRPELLDTRAIVRLAEGKVVEALEDLSEITRWDPKDPVYWLHLGLAQLRANDRAAAQEAWLKARAMGIGNSHLTRYDRQAATEIAAAL